MMLRHWAAAAIVVMCTGGAAAQTEWVLYEGNPVVPGFAVQPPVEH